MPLTLPAVTSLFTSFKPLSEEDVCALITKAPIKCCPLDPIPSSVLAQLLDVLIPVITTMINLSFETGQFASDWKKALLLPALKKAGLEVAFKNFRPISNLPFVSKLSEREAADQLMQHAVNQGLDCKFQSAYKKHHSTETALLKVKNDLLMNMDNQHVTLLVLNLSAAFDTVSHDILLDRLNTRFGVSGIALQWLQWCLADRSQRVSINGVLSDRFELRHGVPQGSCLGPLLFSLYTSKLFEITSAHLPEVHCYTDDTHLYMLFRPNATFGSDEAISAMMTCIADIRDWMISDKLMLNDSKTETSLVGTMPDALKVAILSPMLKKSDADFEQFQNFRPISNLKVVSKLVEKAVAIQLTDHVMSHHLDETFQSAYKNFHSTETALVRVQNDILCAIDNNESVILLLLDLSAAFDTVDHSIMLSRLRDRFRVNGTVLAWFESYLTSRKQFVQVNGCRSTQRSLERGVPQGSVLGPLLYLLYTSPVANIINFHKLQYHLYADDTQLYISFKTDCSYDLSLAKRRVECCVNDIDSWMVNNGLKLNQDKTELVFISSKFRSRPSLEFIQVGDEEIQPKYSARNLGVTIDQCLDLTDHVKKNLRFLPLSFEEHR